MHVNKILKGSNMKKIVIAAVASMVAFSASAASHGKEGKAFVQIGGGYSINSSKGKVAYNIGKSIKAKGAVVDTAVGYHLNNDLSLSVNPVYFTLKGKKKVNGVANKNKAQGYGAFVTARYAVPVGMMVKPYVEAGAGMLKITSKETAPTKGKKSRSSFAVKGGVGVLASVHQNIDLQLGYSIMSPSKQTIKYDKTTGSARKYQPIHTFGAGVVYTF